ncbi:MAG: hypothetical protein AAGA56_22295, partial [Myxococcota bacterium]
MNEMGPFDNPFERFDIDPQAGPAAITERMRTLIGGVDREDERQALREAWEALTLDPRRRLELALEAFPATRPPAPPTLRLAEVPFRPPPPREERDRVW